MDHCTIVGNTAPGVGGVYMSSFTPPVPPYPCLCEAWVTNTIIAFNGPGRGIASGCDEFDPWYSEPVVGCVDLYGNAGGNWVDEFESYGPPHSTTNLEQDPLLCGGDNPDDPYSLRLDSPCAEENNVHCGLIGARDVGCEAPGGPNIFVEFENGSNYIEPEAGTTFEAYVGFSNLEPGNGLTGASFKINRTFAGFALLQEPLIPGWGLLGDAETFGLMVTGDCAEPDSAGVLLVARILYLITTGDSGVIEIVPHELDGAVVFDCDSVQHEWCVRREPSGHGGVWTPPPPGDCPGIGPHVEIAPSSLAFEIAGEPVAQDELLLSNVGTAGLAWSIARAESTDGRASGGPDAFGYRWIDSDSPGGPDFDWQEISEVGTLVDLEEDGFEEVSLPFTFPFYGSEKTSVKISAHGYLTFGSDATDPIDVPIPDPDPPNDLIAPFWTAIDQGIWGIGDTYCHHDAATNSFIVQYDGVMDASHPYEAYYTFEVILRPDGSILFQYDTGYWDLGYPTVGIEAGRDW